MREDPRLLEHVPGKSINLALSERGRSALRGLGLEDEILAKYVIPMRGRLIHDLNGNRRVIPYGRSDQYICSVSRRFLNERLLSEAEKHDNLHIHFDHKSISSGVNGEIRFVSTKTGDELTTIKADLIVGCDGAFSAIRRTLMKMTRFNYTQTYIEHGYIELCIPPTKDDRFAMEVNYLHIWPRGTFMLIALPNLDKSYTVTLFMPFAQFDSIRSEADLLTFFEANFPDAIPLIGRLVVWWHDWLQLANALSNNARKPLPTA